jgi:hypothetical protein
VVVRLALCLSGTPVWFSLLRRVLVLLSLCDLVVGPEHVFLRCAFGVVRYHWALCSEMQDWDFEIRYLMTCRADFLEIWTVGSPG